jgi:HrpA-like RNA helicase
MSKDYLVEEKLLPRCPGWMVNMKLKVVPHLPEIVRRICSDVVVQISSGTGSGKTLCIPSYFMLCQRAIGKLIRLLIAEPTCLNTRQAYDFVANHTHKPYLVACNYQSRSSANFQNAQIRFCTTQSVVNMMLPACRHPNTSSFFRNQYLVIDEFHHPSVENYMLAALGNYLIECGKIFMWYS